MEGAWRAHGWGTWKGYMEGTWRVHGVVHGGAHGGGARTGASRGAWSGAWWGTWRGLVFGLRENTFRSLTHLQVCLGQFSYLDLLNTDLPELAWIRSGLSRGERELHTEEWRPSKTWQVRHASAQVSRVITSTGTFQFFEFGSSPPEYGLQLQRELHADEWCPPRTLRVTAHICTGYSE